MGTNINIVNVIGSKLCYHISKDELEKIIREHFTKSNMDSSKLQIDCGEATLWIPLENYS